jgi:hypothetical protein
MGLTISKEVATKGNIGIPEGSTNFFQTTDKQVVAFISFKNIYGIVNLRWDWLDPKGRLHFTKQAATVKSSEGKYFEEFSAWHVMTIAGDKASRIPGEWSVKVYMNDELLDQKAFTIRQ